MPAIAREGSTISVRAGGGPSLGGVRRPSPSARDPRPRFSKARGLGAKSLDKSPEVRPVRHRAVGSSVRSRSASPVSSLVDNPSVPVPAIAIRPCRPVADDHAPVLGVGVGGVRSRGGISTGDPWGACGAARILSGHFAASALYPESWGFARRRPGQLARAQVLESTGPLSLVEFLGVAHELVEPFELGGQFVEAGPLGRCEPLVLASSELVEQAVPQLSSSDCQASGRFFYRSRRLSGRRSRDLSFQGGDPLTGLLPR